MSDGITDGINAQKAEDKWENEIVPYIVNNQLDRKKPEEMTMQENYYMWIFTRKQIRRQIEELEARLEAKKSGYWDAYVGQGKYRHYKYGGKIKVALK